MVTTIPAGLLVAALLVFLLGKPVRDALTALVEIRADIARRSAPGRAAVKQAQHDLRAAKIRRQAAKIRHQAALREADAAVEQRTVKARAAGRQREIDAATTARVQAIRSRPARPTRRLPSLAPLGRFLVRSVIVLAVVALVVSGVSGIVYGLYKLNQANNRDHQAVVLVCDTDVSPDHKQGNIDTSRGEFVLLPGMYDQTYYDDSMEAIAAFVPGRAYRITYHGGYLIDLYVDRAEPTETGDLKCADND